LSAESWIKQNIQQSLESAQARTTASQAEHGRSSRGEGAERQHLADFAVRNGARSRKDSGEVRMKSPPAPAPSSKSRVYIDPESPDEKVSGPPTPRSLSIRTKSNESYKDAIRQASAAHIFVTSGFEQSGADEKEEAQDCQEANHHQQPFRVKANRDHLRY
jgi:hypothetical protein